MTATTTLPVVLGTGIHASRPSANAVGAGGLYACSTHALIYQTDGVSTWSTWATLAGTGLSDPMTTRGDMIVRNASNVTDRLGRGSAGQVLTSDGTDLAWATPSGSAPAHSYALDNAVAIDATYGDDFAAASLNGRWTRRNFTGGAETYQQGGNGSFMRIALTGRTKGDGYLQTAPGGDWTFMMSYVQRLYGTLSTFGIACVDSAGTGLSTAQATVSGLQFGIYGMTTYTTYASTFQVLASESSLQVAQTQNDRKWWQKLRKSGTNYYAAYSLDGETWSAETAAFSSSITVDRVGMIFSPVAASVVTTALFDIDMFNKIA